jgi:hypothetical protein
MTQPPTYQPAYEPTRAELPPKKRRDWLDVRFTRFISLQLISFWWMLSLIVILACVVVGVITGFFQDTVLDGAKWVVGSLVGGLVAAVLTRLFLEAVAVVFRIANNTSELVKGWPSAVMNGGTGERQPHAVQFPQNVPPRQAASFEPVQGRRQSDWPTGPLSTNSRTGKLTVRLPWGQK